MDDESGGATSPDADIVGSVVATHYPAPTSTGSTLWPDRMTGNLHQWPDLDFHQELVYPLQRLADDPTSVPHIMLFGPSGSGKMARVRCWLRQLYGDAALTSLRPEVRTLSFAPVSQASVTMQLRTSDHHLEMRPADAGVYDRMVVQLIIKDLATAAAVSTEGQPTRPAFRVLVLRNVDALSQEAQAALRRTMEVYVSTCRLVLLCRHVNQIIAPLRSRCLVLRVPSPRPADAERALLHAERILVKGGGPLATPEWRQGLVQALWTRTGTVNMRDLLLQAQIAYQRAWQARGTAALPTMATEPPVVADVEVAIEELAAWVVQLAAVSVARRTPAPPVLAAPTPVAAAPPPPRARSTASKKSAAAATRSAPAPATPNALPMFSPATLPQVDEWVPLWIRMRARLYELLGHGVEPTFVLQRITRTLVHRPDGHDTFRLAATHIAATAESSLHKGSKPMVHAEMALAQLAVAWSTPAALPSS